jgi:hypothetical protein
MGIRRYISGIFNQVFYYFKRYAAEGINPVQWVVSVVLATTGIYLYYVDGWLRQVRTEVAWTGDVFAFFAIIYGIGLLMPYLAGGFYKRDWSYLKKPGFWITALFGVALFTMRSSSHYVVEPLRESFQGLELSNYWFRLVKSPGRGLLIILPLLVFWFFKDRNNQRPYGFTLKNFDTRFYFGLLLLMVPLIAWASFQSDFLESYPRAKNLPDLRMHDLQHAPYYLLYEVLYLLDFVSIEFFFRGFLILALMKYGGTNVLLPMATFYVFIHFGKPAAETISSFFGGMILGIITYYSRSIVGGIIVHMGIAALMELGGWLGNLYWR